jgi:hypothetical protein
MTFSILALGKALSRDNATSIIESTLEQNKFLQFGPWALPSPHAGVLEATPLRNRSQLLGSPLTASIFSHDPPLLHGERVTSWWKGFEHP